MKERRRQQGRVAGMPPLPDFPPFFAATGPPGVFREEPIVKLQKLYQLGMFFDGHGWLGIYDKLGPHLRGELMRGDDKLGHVFFGINS